MKNIEARSIEEARVRIRAYASHTELTFAPAISANYGAEVYFKWENHQPTGSFKIRGATNKILSNLSEGGKRGVVAASTGNHGAATAFVCQRERLNLTLYVPSSIAGNKRQKLEKSGLQLVLVNGPCELAEALARKEARRSGQVFVSPYNDPEVISGQGTCGLEILEDLPEVEEVVVPVGGGGLIAGVAAYLKEKKPGLKITGVEPENSAFIQSSLRLGYLSNDFPEKPTIADAVAGGLEEGAITFDLIREYVDDMVTVTEEAIIRAMKLIFKYQQEKVEGAGALSLAGLISFPANFAGKKTVLIASGGNIDRELWEKIIT
ncbi:MAG: threonine ammonia-lyase [Candidatus Saccharicenans sp.]